MTNAELRKLAENATPGPWVADADRVTTGGPVRMERRAIASFRRSDGMGSRSHAHAPDVEYVAAASPDVIIALLDRCEALEKERDAARNLMPWRSDVVAFAELADRAPRCDAAEDLASWCMMILRAHAAKGGE